MAEANDILRGCKRLEKENRRRERLLYREQIAPLHQSSNLSVTAPPFQPKAASLMAPRSLTGSPPGGDIPSLARGLPPQDLDGGDETSDADLIDSASHRKRRNRGSRSVRGGGSSDSSNQS